MSRPSILTDIEELRADNLTGKYYIPTGNVVANNPEILTTSPLPTNWTGSGKVYTNGQYVLESSMEPTSTTHILSNVSNGINTDSFYAKARTSIESYVMITLPESITVKQFTTIISDVQGIDRVGIEGSNNKTKWDTLLNARLGSGSLTQDLVISTAYKYYRFCFYMDVDDTTVEIKEIKISQYSIPTYKVELSVPDIGALKSNQRILIKTPNFNNTGITATTFNNVSIDTILLPNKYYELVYDSTRYLAREII